MSNVLVMHRCPVCGRSHGVTPARASVAYGRQLTCGPDCESVRRRAMRSEHLDILQRGNAVGATA
jgi:hypothetical protein